MSNSHIQIICDDEQGMMFKIPSSTRNHNYIVNVFYDGRGWWCGCEDHYFRKHECKHIRLAKTIIGDLDE